MKTEQEVIPIFFTIDNAYAPYLDVALRSMIANASKKEKYKIIVLYENVTADSLSKIATVVQEPFEIEFHEMRNQIEGLTDRKENRLRCDYFTMTIYFRLFIAAMFPEYTKGIYIDSDVVVPGDISELYRIDLGDNLLAACPDRSVVNIPELARYMEYAIGIPKTDYINSGVLLMNLKKMRETKFIEHFLYLLNTYHFDNVAPDQDYLNAICHGKILYLEECWDAMPPEGGKEMVLAEPKIIHYNLFLKPWCYDNIPYEEYFWKYAEMSPFYDEILLYKKNYSAEQKKSDKECLKTLVTKAGRLDRQEVTFRKLKESGIKITICL
ncbi:MAG: glycosyltransferase family 8 protein [bacterium]|nr:glycosyltransferase family 8 protein [bacterium]